MRTMLAVGLLLAMVAPVRADDAAEAKAHYKAATAHFAVGEFADAAQEYQSAYKLKQDPALLFNAAQSWRLAGDNQKALVLYKNYLQLYPNAGNTDQVREQIAKLNEAIAAAEQAKTAPPTNTVEPGSQQTAAQPPPVAAPVAPAPAPQVTTKDEGPTPLYTKWWLWTAIGGVVVVGVVVAVAVVETQPGPWTSLPNVGPGATSAALSVHW